MTECTVCCQAAVSSSSSTASWKLPVLEQLELTGVVGGFEPALLKLMPQLRVFTYTPEERKRLSFSDGPPVDLHHHHVTH
jgi:hypothetical protein